MPIHFTTQAANADRIRDDDSHTLATQERQPLARPDRKSYSGPDEVRPGKDINAPGFLKEKDTPEPA